MIGSIGDKIREKIEKEHIVPESRFKIETEKLLYWGVVLLAALLSGVGFSFIVLHVSQFFSKGTVAARINRAKKMILQNISPTNLFQDRKSVV